MKPKVLAVDDDAEFTELITYTLQKKGCVVLTAANGVQGLNLARTELPDVILLDLMLPDLDGLSVFQILRSQPSTKNIPVFIVSALGESWTGKRGTRLRYDHYFKKPVDLKALGQSVRDAAIKHNALLLAAVTEPINSEDPNGKSGRDH
jgi:DNA-binding response OmpR family regulator